MKGFAVIAASVLLITYTVLEKKQFTIKSVYSGSVDLPPVCKPQKSLREEVLEIEKVSINELVPFLINCNELQSKIGIPNSINVSGAKGLYNETKSSLTDTVYSWTYPNIEFLVYNGKANIRMIDFRNSNIQLVHPDITLSFDTSIDQLKEAFPISCKVGYQITEDHTGKKYSIVRLNTRIDWIDEWILKFDGDNLVAIEFWTP